MCRFVNVTKTLGPITALQELESGGHIVRLLDGRKQIAEAAPNDQESPPGRELPAEQSEDDRVGGRFPGSVRVTAECQNLQAVFIRFTPSKSGGTSENEPLHVVWRLSQRVFFADLASMRTSAFYGIFAFHERHQVVCY